HPKVKLFISHGGMLGISEALYCAVPILGVPLFADQMLNIQNNVGKGIGIGIPYNEITENKLMDAIQSLLNNPKGHPNVKVFISYGGMLGTLEAMQYGVPVLGVLIFADQKLRFGRVLPKDALFMYLTTTLPQNLFPQH
ncbi:hypothetical protein Trydic_g4539, partial [Trypoxylus dichotomus]